MANSFHLKVQKPSSEQVSLSLRAAKKRPAAALGTVLMPLHGAQLRIFIDVGPKQIDVARMPIFPLKHSATQDMWGVDPEHALWLNLRGYGPGSRQPKSGPDNPQVSVSTMAFQFGRPRHRMNTDQGLLLPCIDFFHDPWRQIAFAVGHPRA